MRKIIFLIIFFPGFAKAQETLSYAEIDSASYVEYLNNDFKKIRETGKKSLDQGMDFYYLRMRLGIVGYYHGNYEYAVKHFEAAYQMNPADTTGQEYLYYAYLYSGRTESANGLVASASESFQKKVGYKAKRLESIAVGAAAFLNSNIDKNSSNNFLLPNYNRGDVTLNGNAFGQNVMFQSCRNNRFRFYNKLSVFETTSYSIEQFQMPAQHQGRSYSNVQLQYNWAFSYTSKKHYLISAGLAFFQTNTSDLTGHPVPQNGGMQIVFDDIQNKYNNILLSATVGKRISYVFPTLSVTYSNLYSTSQFQTEGALTYYPLGNSKLYGTTSYAYLNNGGKNQQVLVQKIGFRCSDALWLEAKYSTGNHQNYMTSSGFLSFNTLDPILQHAGLDLHVYHKKTEFILGYSYQLRQAAYDQYVDPNNFQTATYKYTNNNLTTTIKWNF